MGWAAAVGDTPGVNTHDAPPPQPLSSAVSPATAAAASPAPATAADPIAAAAQALRHGVVPLIEALAGDPPRPSRLVRLAGLDKSMASRLAQAARAGSDAELLHLLPSPAGLRMLLERAAAAGLGGSLSLPAAAAVEQFQALIDHLPGGRQALDARIGEHSDQVRQKREHMARQAAFKAQSFLFGHYCDTLTTALFLLPSATPGWLDMVEVHRRIGLHRVRPGAPVPVLSVYAAQGDLPEQGPAMATLEGDAASADMADYLIPQVSSQPLPPLRIEREGPLATFILDGSDNQPTPERLTTALRVLRVEASQPQEAFIALRNYLLHLPCARLVRDLYLAPGVWPGASPQVGFFLPGPPGVPLPAARAGDAEARPQPHYRELPLSATLQPLAATPRGFELKGVADQRQALEAALARAGAPSAGWRGWRCDMPYPLPLVDMHLGLQLQAAAPQWPPT